MAARTTQQQLDIGNASAIYASNELKNGQRHGGSLDEKLPILIFAVTQGLQWLYDLDPTNEDLDSIGNYLISICRDAPRAESNIVGGGSTPSILGNSGFSFLYLIPITAAYFSNATTYNDSRIAGKTLKVFWNNINRFLLSSEFSQPSTGGITILVDGFDAGGANSDADFDIFIVDPSGSNQNPTNSNTRVIS